MHHRQKTSFIKRGFAWLVFSFFIVAQAHALELSPDTGKIDKSLYGWNGKTLFLIQEAHVDYNGQKAIINILQSLIHQKALRLIMVEGGWDNVSLTYLRSYATAESRLRIAEDFLKQGKISAEEYLDVVSEEDLLLWGIEDKRLYQQNLRAFLSLTSEKTKIDAASQALRDFLRSLEEKIYSKELFSFASQKNLYDNQQISILEYLFFIQEKFPKAAADLKTIQELLSFAGRDSQFESAKINVEKTKAFNALAKKLSKLEISELKGTLNAGNAQEELNFLQLLLKAYQDYPNVKRPKGLRLLMEYEKVLQRIAGLDSGSLRKEISQAESRVTDSLALHEEERDLLEIRRQLQMMFQLFQLRYTPEDYEKFLKAYPSWNVQGWIADLKKLAEKAAVNAAPLQHLDYLETQIKDAKSFYDAAMKREEALIQNTIDKMKQTPDAAAAVITGGFHTEALSRALNQQGYTVIQISPRFEPEDMDAHQKKYFEILKSRVIL